MPGLGFVSSSTKKSSLISCIFVVLSHFALAMVPLFFPSSPILSMLAISALVLVAVSAFGRCCRWVLHVSTSAPALVFFNILFILGVYIAVIREGIPSLKDAVITLEFVLLMIGLHRWLNAIFASPLDAKAMKKMTERFRGRKAPTFSLYVSNLPLEISKTELQAMFCRAGTVIDTFIPTERSSGKHRGFGFVIFNSERDANLGLELVNGRSWRGRRILVDIARPRTAAIVPGSSNISIDNPRPMHLHPPNDNLGLLHLHPPNGNIGLLRHQAPNAWNRPLSCLTDSSVGWIIKDGHSHFIRVAPWLVDSETKILSHSLIGFLKQNMTVVDVDRWLVTLWGKSAARLRLLEEDVIHIQLHSAEEVRQVLSCAEGLSPKPLTNFSPFIALDRWTEVIGVKVYGSIGPKAHL